MNDLVPAMRNQSCANITAALKQFDHDSLSNSSALLTVASALRQNDQFCHHSQVVVQRALVVVRTGFVQMRQAMALDPLSSGGENELGYTFYTARQYDQAIRVF